LLDHAGFTPATRFSVSGVPGVSQASQQILSAGVARIVVSTGSFSGTLSISDGTNVGTITVANVLKIRRYLPH
jgi:hypothetical protein